MKEIFSKYKVPIIIGTVVIILIVAVVGIRSMNAKRKAEEQARVEQEQAQQDAQLPVEEEEEDEDLQNSYQSNLSIKAKEEQKRKKEAEKRLEEKREAERKAEEERKAKEHAQKAKPTYGDAVMVWDSDGVPDRMMDGSSVKKFYSNFKLSDAGESRWGSPLTDADKLTKNFYMIGVDQNEDDYVTGVQLQSFGWYLDNADSIPQDSAIKFTDLNVVGSLADDHLALLCCYNWYSIWGLKDTLMVFEDLSGTLKPEDFAPGKIFSAIAYKHNIKTVNVDGYRIMHVQYDTFK